MHNNTHNFKPESVASQIILTKSVCYVGRSLHRKYTKKVDRKPKIKNLRKTSGFQKVFERFSLFFSIDIIHE